MVRKDIIKKLKSISNKANSKVECINYGGCAVMASIVGERLEKMGIPVEGVINYGNPKDIRKKNEKTDKWSAWDWEDNGASFHHVALRFKIGNKTYTYDTDRLHEGSMSFGEYLQYTPAGRFGSGMKVKELKRIAATKDYWNKEFDRKNIKTLRKIVEKEFSNDKK